MALSECGSAPLPECAAEGRVLATHRDNLGSSPGSFFAAAFSGVEFRPQGFWEWCLLRTEAFSAGDRST